MSAVRPMPSPQEPSDEELMRRLAAGRQEALGMLHSRYASLMFNMAARTLDRGTAEEIVQDVFLSVWRNAAVFAPERGAFRPWVLQIAHFRILNEVRRRSRRPQQQPDPEGLLLTGLTDPGPEPEESAWRESLHSVLQSAVKELSPPQRHAVDLAFFKDLTHKEVAAELRIPLGTAKTRIRGGLQALRGALAPVLAGLVLVALLAPLGIRYHAEQAMRERDERALALVTASTTKVIHVAAAPGMPQIFHGNYRGREGAPIIVLTLSNFPAPPPWKAYQAWRLHQGAWASLGLARPDARGGARMIAEGPDLAVPPEAIEVTLEPAGGSPSPSGLLMIVWRGN